MAVYEAVFPQSEAYQPPEGGREGFQLWILDPLSGASSGKATKTSDGCGFIHGLSGRGSSRHGPWLLCSVPGCHPHRPGTERTTKVFSQGSGGQKSEAKVLEGPLLPRSPGKGPSCFFQLLVAQHSLACVHITPVSASVISRPCGPCICVFCSSVSCRDTCHWI